MRSQPAGCAMRRARPSGSAGSCATPYRGSIPVFARLYRACAAGDAEELEHWNAFLFAARESAEIRAEDRYLGAALARLLHDLGIDQARPGRPERPWGFAAAFALGTERFGIALEEAAQGYAWIGCEQLVAAAVKLVPLRPDRRPTPAPRARCYDPGYRACPR
jgi:urease accessory protein UreF